MLSLLPPLPRHRLVLVLVLLPAIMACIKAESGPGTYANFQFPAGFSNATSMRVQHVWKVLPRASETQGNAVFAATQVGTQCP